MTNHDSRLPEAEDCSCPTSTLGPPPDIDDDKTMLLTVAVAAHGAPITPERWQQAILSLLGREGLTVEFTEGRFGPYERSLVPAAGMVFFQTWRDPDIAATSQPIANAEPWQTGLSTSRNVEDWPVPADSRLEPFHENNTIQVWEKHATLRRIGWLDQKGRVWLAVPPQSGFDGGSLTPLLIDPGERPR